MRGHNAAFSLHRVYCTENRTVSICKNLKTKPILKAAPNNAFNPILIGPILNDVARNIGCNDCFVLCKFCVACT